MRIARWVLAFLIPTLTIGVTLFTGSLAATATISSASPISGDGSPSDTNIGYFGRWDKSSSSTYTSYWPGAYFKTNFTGTHLKLKVGGPANFYVRIDAGDDTLFPVSSAGTVNLTSTALSTGPHTLRVAVRSETDVLQFQGLVLDSGASTLTPGIANNIVEFIGDSITAGYSDTRWALSDYAWLAGEKLNVEHTQIAYSGICLVDGVQCFSPNAIGMSRQYFKLKTVDYTASGDWNFGTYQPSVVVINLGSNDAYFQIDDTVFQNSYNTFLQNIRQKFPNTEIIVLRAFNGSKAGPTQQAVNTRIGAGDTKVHFIDTTNWVSASDTNDGTHPSDAGHIKIANLLIPILQQYLASCPSFTVTSSLDDATGFACGTLSYALNKAAVDNTNTNITISLPTVSFISGAMPPVTSNSGNSITLMGACTISNNRSVSGASLQAAAGTNVPGLTINMKVTLDGINLTGFSGYALKFTGKDNLMSCVQTNQGGIRVTQGGQVRMLSGNQVITQSS